LSSNLQIAELLKLKKTLILASQSPRRKRLLKQLGFEFITIPANLEEDGVGNVSPAKLSAKLAMDKALEVRKKVKKSAIIIGADTIVFLENRILTKPKNKHEAIKILKTLSGKTHTVYTGIALIDTDTGKKASKVQKTEVTFRKLDEEEIRCYVATGSPLDKAGAYGIQDDFGAVFVSHINGCYYNIVGLPLELLYSTLKQFIRKHNL
jgi:septum formation protein